MNRTDLRRRLGQLRGSRAAVRELVDEARAALGARWLDQQLYDSISRYAAECGEPFGARSFTPLAIGESWLMLAGEAGADVVRADARPTREVALERAAAQRHVNVAIQGLTAAARAAGSALPSATYATALTVSADPALRIDGSSLGLCVCAAALSDATRTVARSDTAGTASVDVEGRLHPIEYLAEKCAALVRQWPEVTRVVISADQRGVPNEPRLTFVHAASVGEAMTHFGLEFARVVPSVADLRQRLKAIEHEEEHAHDVAQWEALSLEARDLALRFEAIELPETTEAVVVSALLASHGGNNVQALEILAAHDLTQAPIALRAKALVYEASFLIERDRSVAIRRAEQGLRLASELEAKAERLALVGRAQGTLGRALTADGRYAEAEQHLRAAYAHHQKPCHGEAARSACYLACCLRMMGRPADALATADEARNHAQRDQQFFHVARTSASYALLERGRALAALERWQEAIEALQLVIGANATEASYPALGARRTIVGAYLRAARRDEARNELEACLRVAIGGPSPTLCQVGAVACAAELASAAAEGREPLLPRADLRAAWVRCFNERAESVVSRWIY